MTAAPTTARAQFSIQRTYAASIDEAWALWTTKSGIESWWGPEGFDVTVTSLDLRPGGELVYLMTAMAPEQVAFDTLVDSVTAQIVVRPGSAPEESDGV